MLFWIICIILNNYVNWYMYSGKVVQKFNRCDHTVQAICILWLWTPMCCSDWCYGMLLFTAVFGMTFSWLSTLSACWGLPMWRISHRMRWSWICTFFLHSVLYIFYKIRKTYNVTNNYMVLRFIIFMVQENYCKLTVLPIVLPIHIALFLSDEGPMLETLDHTIRIGSTPTFLYFDLPINSGTHTLNCSFFIYPRQIL